MKYIISSLTVLVAALMFSTASYADWKASKISTVYPLANGGIIIILSDAGSTCANASPPYYFIRAGHNGVTQAAVKTLYATALTAFAMDKVVAINFDPSTDGCDVNRLKLESLN